MSKPKKQVDDRFKKFGTVSFTGITKVNDFVAHLEKGKVAGTKCKNCGKVYFPPRADCCECLKSDMEWYEVEGKGRLVTYSTLQYAPVGFEKDLPYTIALVDFGDYKVFGRLSPSLKEDEVQVGMEVIPKVVKLEDGQFTYTFDKA